MSFLPHARKETINCPIALIDEQPVPVGETNQLFTSEIVGDYFMAAKQGRLDLPDIPNINVGEHAFNLSLKLKVESRPGAQVLQDKSPEEKAANEILIGHAFLWYAEKEPDNRHWVGDFAKEIVEAGRAKRSRGRRRIGQLAL